ncbi:Txe/YoeB family addiction module toxin [Capnocytophaga sp.]|uniref:Txe/YoeB family addiction module toxin n=1 Tax=Capnocytophaga sp. TaxID=44737 RepID=UPI0026DBE2FE|nr:Txe/YoeB family addiction module toxin [Capnocytophaga sp.]MDO5105823.1 Txe/YoeB family addiction module toxin [Capnocytophaga sp.]
MEEYSLQETEEFIEDINKHLKSGQKKNVQKVGLFLKELVTNPTTGTGQVEPLKGYGDRSVWSRRIDKKHRLVYEIFQDEKIVKLLSAYGHYDE